MEKQDVHNWSRHYDTMQWTTIGFFVAGMVTLFSQDPDKAQLNPNLIGVLLSPIVAFYTSSFRAFRRRVHGNLEKEEEKELLSPSGMYRQKYVTALLLISVNVYCYYNLIEAAESCGIESLLMILAALTSVFILLWHHCADGVFKRGKVDPGAGGNG